MKYTFLDLSPYPIISKNKILQQMNLNFNISYVILYWWWLCQNLDKKNASDAQLGLHHPYIVKHLTTSLKKMSLKFECQIWKCPSIYFIFNQMFLVLRLVSIFKSFTSGISFNFSDSLFLFLHYQTLYSNVPRIFWEQCHNSKSPIFTIFLS